MRRAIQTGLPPETAPFSHAVVAGGLLHTATLPIRPDGTWRLAAAAHRPRRRWPTCARPWRPPARPSTTSARSSCTSPGWRTSRRWTRSTRAFSARPTRRGYVWWSRRWRCRERGSRSRPAPPCRPSDHAAREHRSRAALLVASAGRCYDAAQLVALALPLQAGEPTGRATMARCRHRDRFSARAGAGGARPGLGG